MALNVEYWRGGKCVYMFRYTYAGIRVITMQIKKRGDTHRNRVIRPSRALWQRYLFNSLLVYLTENRIHTHTTPIHVDRQTDKECAWGRPRLLHTVLKYYFSDPSWHGTKGLLRDYLEKTKKKKVSRTRILFVRGVWTMPPLMAHGVRRVHDGRHLIYFKGRVYRLVEPGVCSFVLLNRYWGINVRSQSFFTSETLENALYNDPSNRKKLETGKNWRFWYKTSNFEILSVHDLQQAPRNSGRDDTAGIIIVWWTSPPLILQIHSLHQVATGTPSHLPPRRRGIIIAIFHDFGTNSMVL